VGVAAGQYLAGLLSELSQYFHLSGPFSPHTVGGISASFAIVVTIYFWWENTKGVSESSEKALHIMKLVTVMVVILIGWCIYTAVQRHSSLPPFPYPSNIHLTSALSDGWPTAVCRTCSAIIAIFIASRSFRAGHERRRIAGAVVPRNRKPQLLNLRKAAWSFSIYSLVSPRWFLSSPL